LSCKLIVNIDRKLVLTLKRRVCVKRDFQKNVAGQ